MYFFDDVPFLAVFAFYLLLTDTNNREGVPENT